MKKLQVPGTKYVISFDESLNKVLQKEQMDIIVRFWDKEKNKVSSRYLNSQFLGHTRAADLLQKFREALGKLKPILFKFPWMGQTRTGSFSIVFVQTEH